MIVYDDCVGVAGGSLVGEDVCVEGAAEVAAVAAADDRGVLSSWRHGKGFFDSQKSVQQVRSVNSWARWRLWNDESSSWWT